MGVWEMAKRVWGHKDLKIKALQERLEMAEADKSIAVDHALEMEERRDQINYQLAKRTGQFCVAFLVACPGSFLLGGFYLQKLLEMWW